MTLVLNSDAVHKCYLLVGYFLHSLLFVAGEFIIEFGGVKLKSLHAVVKLIRSIH